MFTFSHRAPNGVNSIYIETDSALAMEFLSDLGVLTSYSKDIEKTVVHTIEDLAKIFGHRGLTLLRDKTKYAIAKDVTFTCTLEYINDPEEMFTSHHIEKILAEQFVHPIVKRNTAHATLLNNIAYKVIDQLTRLAHVNKDPIHGKLYETRSKLDTSTDLLEGILDDERIHDKVLDMADQVTQQGMALGDAVTEIVKMIYVKE